MPGLQIPGSLLPSPFTCIPPIYRVSDTNKAWLNKLLLTGRPLHLPELFLARNYLTSPNWDGTLPIPGIEKKSHSTGDHVLFFFFSRLPMQYDNSVHSVRQKKNNPHSIKLIDPGGCQLLHYMPRWLAKTIVIVQPCRGNVLTVNLSMKSCKVSNDVGIVRIDRGSITWPHCGLIVTFTMVGWSTLEWLNGSFNFFF